MLNRERFFLDLCLPCCLAFWMLFGGLLFWRGWVPVAFIANMAVLSLMAITALGRGCWPALLGPALFPLLAAALSTLGNLEIFPFSIAWLLVYISGILALLSSAALGEERLLVALSRSGWIWLILWPLPRAWGWVDNRNLLAVWPVVFILVILAQGKPWWWAAPHLGMLLALGSRGALLGLCAGLLVWHRPRVDRGRTALLAAAGLAFLWTLIAFRPLEAFNRFSYWEQALKAVVDHNLWLGLGPGGIYARNSIAEIDDLTGFSLYFHPHAHNLFVQVLAELGLIGLLALSLSVLWILRTKLHGRWQLSILAALLIHCLVDLPIYFPGQWMIFMAIAGAVGRGLRVPGPSPIRAVLSSPAPESEKLPGRIGRPYGER